MNQSLYALRTKLNEQLDELNLLLHQEQNQAKNITKQIKEMDDRINQLSPSALIINPDLEINRLNFVIQEQGKQEQLITDLKNHQNIERKLKEKIQRLNAELKMLKKYLQREESSDKK
ncbi:hypothetical protein [Legionella sp.]|uniref:hypothetical protein n=1 Tax=Legionella sp. TaxID=459 RepID=UPI003CA5F0C8